VKREPGMAFRHDDGRCPRLGLFVGSCPFHEIPPVASSQFSRRQTGDPRRPIRVTRTMVSRQGGLPRRLAPVGRAMPAPPMNPTFPSTTIRSRWLLLLNRFSVYQRIG
jgi:hypothetical protein